ncbi:MAG: T9SS type A sorting domain-containing protein [Bacteroidales bacterium]|nr:T9SS type A sorting domain-containing protein [Bacteroidales bacterium]
MRKKFLFNNFKKMQVLTIIICFILSSFDLFAGDIIIKENGETSLKITENTYAKLQLVNSLADIKTFNVKTDEYGKFTELVIKDYSSTYIIGSPKLPVKRRLIEIPIDANIKVNIINYNIKEYKLEDFGIIHKIIPAQPPLPKYDGATVEFQYNAGVYTTNEFSPSEMVTVDVLGMMRGIRIARINIAPVQYNPVTNIIRVYEDIDFELIFENGDITNTIESKKQNCTPYFNAVNKFLLNFKPLQSKELITDSLITDSPVKYVIVSDPMFHDVLQPFIEWKTKKGFVVIEAYTDDPNVGNTTTSIKAYLEDLYNQGSSTDPPPAFVVFVGDVQQIPAFPGTTGGHPTDLYYCEYTGDLFPELYYGRFSAQNIGQLQPQIDKTLEYEQYTMPDPSYLDEVVLVAGMDSGHGHDWGNGQINYGTENYFNLAHGITAHVYLYPNSGGQSSQIIQDISDGITYANYTAHCGSSGWSNPQFTTSDIPGLQNEHEYGLWVGNCCSSSAFQNSECFAEAALRAENKGAVGYIGGSNSTMWDPDYYWGVGVGPITEDPPLYEETTLGAYDCQFHDHGEPIYDWYITQAQMFVAGNIAVQEGAPSSATYYWEVYCLMGDPSLMIYYSEPPEISVTYPALMPLASTSFTVTTEPWAYVAISKDGVLYGAAIADETGIIEVPIEPITVPGTADIIVTKQNGEPFYGTVTVASPDGPYVLFNNLEIDDSAGNNNGLADFGEDLLFDVTLENVGGQEATNLIGVISSSDEYITITNATHSWPNIPGGATLLQTGAFALTVDDFIPDQHTVMFDLEVTDADSTWYSSFSIILNAPVLTIGNLTIDDSNGNNNGRLDPGEEADIIIPNTNEGHCEALNTVANLITSSTLITINNTSFDLNTLSPGETKDAIFNIIVNPSAQIGDVVDMNYVVASGVYTAQENITVCIGILVEDFETGNFENFAWEMGGNADWTICQSNPYEGAYCAQSGAITDYQSSELFITMDVTADDQISFARKVSSESTYDFLKFYIDGILKGEWSGEVAWEEVSYPVTVGQHTFKWEYYKDVSLSTGSDCGWIDYIIFPPVGGSPGPLTVTATANPSEICNGESSQLYALPSGGTGNYSYEWSPQTGLSDPYIYNPIATPTETTTYTVNVDDGVNIVNADVTVTVYPVPETPTITQQNNSLVSSSEIGNQWYDSNGLIPGATDQIYYPTHTDDYYVIVTNEYGCESEQSNIIHFIYTGITELSNGESLNIYPNPFTEKVTIDYLIKKNSDVKIIIYNKLGQVIDILIDQADQSTGFHRIHFDASDIKAGIYYCKIQTDNYTYIKKLILSK